MNTIIEMTPFVFEDGNIYCFKIVKREGSSDFHDLYVYSKATIKKKFLWWTWENVRYEQLNEKGELVPVSLDTCQVKRDIKKVIMACGRFRKLVGWDGFVGNVPEDMKKSMQRDSKLKDLFGE